MECKPPLGKHFIDSMLKSGSGSTRSTQIVLDFTFCFRDFPHNSYISYIVIAVQLSESLCETGQQHHQRWWHSCVFACWKRWLLVQHQAIIQHFFSSTRMTIQHFFSSTRMNYAKGYVKLIMVIMNTVVDSVPVLFANDFLTSLVWASTTHSKSLGRRTSVDPMFSSKRFSHIFGQSKICFLMWNRGFCPMYIMVSQFPTSPTVTFTVAAPWDTKCRKLGGKLVRSTISSDSSSKEML